MADIEEAFMTPIVIMVMAIMDYVAWQVISQVAGGNAFWYIAALGMMNIAVVIGTINKALE